MLTERLSPSLYDEDGVLKLIVKTGGKEASGVFCLICKLRNYKNMCFPHLQLVQGFMAFLSQKNKTVWRGRKSSKGGLKQKPAAPLQVGRICRSQESVLPCLMPSL